MSIITKLAKEVGELSDDAVRALRRVLPKNATVAQAKDAYERIMRELPEEIDFSVTPAASRQRKVPAAPRTEAGDLTVTAPKRKPAAPATPPKRKPAASKPPKPSAPAIIRNRSGTPGATAEDVLREAEKPSKGSPSYADWRAKNPDTGKLFDMSNLSAVPNVPQFQIPRINPAVVNRLYNEAVLGPEYKLGDTLPRYGYRNVSHPNEIDALLREGYMLPREGKTNKYFTMSDREVPPEGNRGVKPILRVRSDKIPNGRAVSINDVEMWDNDTGTWTPVRKARGGLAVKRKRKRGA